MLILYALGGRALLTGMTSVAGRARTWPGDAGSSRSCSWCSTLFIGIGGGDLPGVARRGCGARWAASLAIRPARGALGAGVIRAVARGGWRRRRPASRAGGRRARRGARPARHRAARVAGLAACGRRDQQSMVGVVSALVASRDGSRWARRAVVALVFQSHCGAARRMRSPGASRPRGWRASFVLGRCCGFRLATVSLTMITMRFFSTFPTSRLYYVCARSWRRGWERRRSRPAVSTRPGSDRCRSCRHDASADTSPAGVAGAPVTRASRTRPGRAAAPRARRARAAAASTGAGGEPASRAWNRRAVATPGRARPARAAMPERAARPETGASRDDRGRRDDRHGRNGAAGRCRHGRHGGDGAAAPPAPAATTRIRGHGGGSAGIGRAPARHRRARSAVVADGRHRRRHRRPRRDWRRGNCTPTNCSDGCCTDDLCIRIAHGHRNAARRAQSCAPCGGCQICSATGQCRIDPASRWTDRRRVGGAGRQQLGSEHRRSRRLGARSVLRIREPGRSGHHARPRA